MYKVFVYTQGRMDYEFVKDFKSEQEAIEWVNKARDRRDTDLGSIPEAVKNHLKKLDWIITKIVV